MRNGEARAVPLLLALAASLILASSPLEAQEPRTVVFGQVGGADITANDSSAGKTFMWGGGISRQLRTHLAVEGDATTAALNPTRFGSQFRTTILTASVLYLGGNDRLGFAAGGGYGAWIERSRAEITFQTPPPPGFCRDRPGTTCREIRPGVYELRNSDTLGVFHGRGGVRWGASRRAHVRVDGVMWIGEGLSAAIGALAGIGYRF